MPISVKSLDCFMWISRVLITHTVHRVGHVNHTLFWENLAPASSNRTGPPTGELADAINQAFGSFEDFKTKFNAQTAAVQGSGWGWLGYNKTTGGVEIATCANQDPLSTTGTN